MVIILAETSLNNIYLYKYIINNIFILFVNYPAGYNLKYAIIITKYALNQVQQLGFLPVIP